MELKRDSRIEEDTDQVLNTQPLRVIDHVLSLLCCGKGHSSLTGIKLLGDHLQQWGYLPKEKWEKKYPITRDKIILLNWIKEHISPKTFTVKDALLECVGELKLLEGKMWSLKELMDRKKESTQASICFYFLLWTFTWTILITTYNYLLLQSLNEHQKV